MRRPQLVQKRCPAAIGAPQSGQARPAPHTAQKRAPGRFSRSHDQHRIAQPLPPPPIPLSRNAAEGGETPSTVSLRADTPGFVAPRRTATQRSRARSSPPLPAQRALARSDRGAGGGGRPHFRVWQHITSLHTCRSVSAAIVRRGDWHPSCIRIAQPHRFATALLRRRQRFLKRGVSNLHLRGDAATAAGQTVHGSRPGRVVQDVGGGPRQRATRSAPMSSGRNEGGPALGGASFRR